MKTLKKCIAFVLAAGLMLSAMTVFASDEEMTDENPSVQSPCPPAYDYVTSGDKTNISPSGDGTYCYIGNIAPNSGNSEIAPQNGDIWIDTANGLRCVWVESGCNSGWVIDYGDNFTPEAGTAASPTQTSAAAAAQGAAAQSAVDEGGFVNAVDMYSAAEKGMSAGEYYNNVVTSTPGIENAITVGQGGNLVVNGVETNMSATISKVNNRAYVDSVRIEQEGRLLNVVDVQYPAVEATINFYTPGITGEMDIVALQYNSGVWVNVEVAEVRADHVVLNMKGNGVVAFIAK